MWTRNGSDKPPDSAHDEQGGILVSFIIVHHNAPHSLAACLASLYRYCQRPDYEVIVIDNASADRSWRNSIPDGQPGLQIIESSENLGFAAANNRAVRHARGTFLFLINPDIVFMQDPIPDMLAFHGPDLKIGTIGPKLVYPDGRLQPSRGTFPHLLLTISQLFRLKRLLPRDEILIPVLAPLLGNLFAQWRKADRTQVVDYTTGAALWIRRDLFIEMNGFDERFFLYFEEIDLCKRLHEKGYRNYFLPSVTMVHEVSSSTETAPGFKKQHFQQSLLSYYGKHASPGHVHLIKALLHCLNRKR
ncbi:glycosyltransferase family 2 protein [bacterium]|nr:glycosyltransferase family 2 protein [bacterium]